MEKCPICNSELKHERYAGEQGIEEEYFICPNKDYSYEYSYGFTGIIVGKSYFNYSYLDNEETLKQINHDIKKEIKNLKSIK